MADKPGEAVSDVEFKEEFSFGDLVLVRHILTSLEHSRSFTISILNVSKLFLRSQLFLGFCSTKTLLDIFEAILLQFYLDFDQFEITK